MDTNKMRDLKALAEAATQSHGARRVEVDHNGVHVIGDGSWKILSAWHTPDGKGAHNAEFAAAASPATVLALLAEIESTETRLHDVAVLCATVEQERDQLKAENDALRGVMAAVIAEIPHAKHVQPGNSPGHSHRVPGIWDEDNGPKAGNECGWCKVWNTAVAMAKEANHG